MAEEAETSLTNLSEACCTKDDSDTVVQNGNNKREHNDSKEDLSIPIERSEISDEEASKKVKSENDRKDGESSVVFGRRARRSRSYRTRVIESDSDDDGDNTLCERGASSVNDRTTNDTGDTLISKSITTITTGPASEMDETSADTSRDTETDHMEPTSPSAMETGSAASGNTDNDGTGKTCKLQYNILFEDSSFRIFGLFILCHC